MANSLCIYFFGKTFFRVKPFSTFHYYFFPFDMPIYISHTPKCMPVSNPWSVNPKTTIETTSKLDILATSHTCQPDQRLFHATFDEHFPAGQDLNDCKSFPQVYVNTFLSFCFISLDSSFLILPISNFSNP